MRNGMSVQEVYDALDQLDRLKEAFERQRQEHLKLQTAVARAEWYLGKTAKTYKQVSDSAESFEDQLEFLAKASGLLEARQILHRYLKGDEV